MVAVIIPNADNFVAAVVSVIRMNIQIDTSAGRCQALIEVGFENECVGVAAVR